MPLYETDYDAILLRMLLYEPDFAAFLLPILLLPISKNGAGRVPLCGLNNPTFPEASKPRSASAGFAKR